MVDINVPIATTLTSRFGDTTPNFVTVQGVEKMPYIKIIRNQYEHIQHLWRSTNHDGHLNYPVLTDWLIPA